MAMSHNKKSPYGVTEVTGTDAIGNAQPLRFTAREYEAETGMYYYRNRYYPPEFGRFISEDPLRFGAGDVNWYAYVGGNPVMYGDPLGLARIMCRKLDVPLPYLRNSRFYHVQIFYTDGTNEGYFKTQDGQGRVRDDENHTEDEYRFCDQHVYDDAIMRQAVASVNQYWGNESYKLSGYDSHNCQDFISDVRRKYMNIRFMQQMRP